MVVAMVVLARCYRFAASFTSALAQFIALVSATAHTDSELRTLSFTKRLSEAAKCF